jgi:hypothetical protein
MGLNRITTATLLSGFLLFAALGCSKTSDKAEQIVSPEESKKLISELISKPREEMVALLAIKYRLDPAIINNIVRTYLSSHDQLYRLLNLDNSPPNNANKSVTVFETIQQLNKEHNIEPSILAAIVIDYKIWSAVDAAGQND